MSLLEDARRLAGIPLEAWCGTGSDGYCIACDTPVRYDGSGHAPDCPVLALPKIVAALEKVEIVLDPGAFTQDVNGRCVECGGVVGTRACRPDICDTSALRELMGTEVALSNDKHAEVLTGTTQ